MRKTFIRFFTIADYEEEEIWLRELHRCGWKMVDFKPPMFYICESCEPEDVVYRLDFKNNTQTGEYMQMLRDFGWDCYFSFFGWLYFRKPADVYGEEGEDELFSDNESRVDMAEQVYRKRLIPITLIFLCCVIPNLVNAINGVMGVFSGILGAFFGAMFAWYLFVVIHCASKLNRIREKYQDRK